MQAGPFDAEGLDAGATVDQRLEQGFGAGSRQLELPFVADLARSLRNGRLPRPILRTRTKVDDRPQPATSFVNRALKHSLALGNDGNPFAQPLGMGDHMGREDNGDAGGGLVANQLLQLFLIERVEAGEWLVQHDQPGLVNDGAKELDGLRHALGKSADRPLCPVFRAARL